MTAAETLPLDLQPGASCLQRELLEQSLSAMPMTSVGTDDLTVEVRGSTHDPRTAVIRLLQNGQEVSRRTFSPGPPRCADFHNAVALTISLMLKSLDSAPAAPPAEPARTAPPRPRTPAPLSPYGPPAPRVTSRPVRIVTSHASDRPATSSPLAVGTRAAFVLGSHVGAKTVLGARLDLSLTRSYYGLDLGLLTLLSQADTLADTQVRYVTRPLAASVSGCVGALPPSALRLRGCLGFLAGRLRSRSLARADVEAGSATFPWRAAQATLELSVRLSARWAVVLGVTPVYAPRKTRVGVDARGDPQELLPRFGCLFAIGLGAEIYRQGSREPTHE